MERVNLKNYQYNLDVLKRLTNKAVIPILKSDAYGLGLVKVASYIKNCDIIGVVDLKEAILLSCVKKEFQILILNKLRPDEFNIVSKIKNAIITITSLDDIKNVLKYSLNVKLHLYVDTGMNRFGIKSLDEYKQIINEITCHNLKLDGLYTHITSVNNFKKQVERFDEFIQIYRPKIVHVCSSNTLLLEGNKYDASRVGLILIDESLNNHLKEVIKVTVSALEVRCLDNGDTLGYNESFKAANKTYVAILPIGYYNGFDRNLTGYEVYSKGHYYKIIGNICMNHMFIEVDEDFSLSQEIEIISKNNPISKMANYLNTIPGEVLARLNLDKIYKW